MILPFIQESDLITMARYQPHDRFYQKARAQGLPSRAAFKLEELIARFKLIRPGARVADIGCAPGG
jgi:23S rRNA (uridine2552-2'-O)-methyltransferase